MDTAQIGAWQRLALCAAHVSVHRRVLIAASPIRHVRSV